MKKVVMILTVVVLGSLFSCSQQEEIAPMSAPEDLELTDGDDDDEDCGQIGGGCPGTGN